MLAAGVRTLVNCGVKLISGSYTPSSDSKVLSAKRTLPRDTSMSLLLSSARRIASLRVSVNSASLTPTRVRSGTGGTGSRRSLSNGSLRRSWSGIGDFVIGSCAIAAVLSRNEHGRSADEITLSNLFMMLASCLRLHLRTLLKAVCYVDDDCGTRFETRDDVEFVAIIPPDDNLLEMDLLIPSDYCHLWSLCANNQSCSRNSYGRIG